LSVVNSPRGLRLLVFGPWSLVFDSVS